MKRNDNLSTRKKFDNYEDEKLLELFKKEYNRIKPINKDQFVREYKDIPPLWYFYERLKVTTWNELKSLSQIEVKNIKRNKKEWMGIIKDTINSLGYVPTAEEFEKHANVSTLSFRPYLGRYNKAIILAGFTPKNPTPIDVSETKEELLNEYIAFCKDLKKLASFKDLKNCPDIYDANIFIIRFGGMTELKTLANKVLKYDNKMINTAKKYSKEQLEKLLLESYKKNGNKPLTKKEINEDKTLPTTRTICTYFNTTKITTVWNEIKTLDLKQT